MGFDITALNRDKLEDNAWEEKNEVAYHRAYMGGFRMMTEQGYDWFDLINANDCYGGVSGNGETKGIKLKDLKNALYILINFKVKKLSSEDRDEISDRRPTLKDFMEKCIKWCEENNKEGILIYFG